MDSQLAKREEKEAREALELCRGLAFDTTKGRSEAAEVLKEVKRRGAGLHEREQAITKPLEAGLASARALFRPARTFYAECEALIKSGLQNGVERALQATEAAAQGATPEALAALEVPELPEGVSVRRLPKIRVIDIGIVPRKFLLVDTKAVLQALRAKDIVPGVEIYYESSVAVKL